MRQIEDAEIEEKLAECDERFNDLSRRIVELQSEQARIQGEYRTWASMKSVVAPAPAPVE